MEQRQLRDIRVDGGPRKGVSQKYGYKTRTYTIPARYDSEQIYTSSQLTRMLYRELDDRVTEEEGEQSVLILCYSGYARFIPPHRFFLRYTPVSDTSVLGNS